MSTNSKMFALDELRNEYRKFMEKVMSIQGMPIPKQQAAFRFEEGHMWMQQAIIHFPEQQPQPPQAPQEAAQEPVPEGEPTTETESQPAVMDVA